MTSLSPRTCGCEVRHRRLIASFSPPSPQSPLYHPPTVCVCAEAHPDDCSSAQHPCLRVPYAVASAHVDCYSTLYHRTHHTPARTIHALPHHSHVSPLDRTLPYRRHHLPLFFTSCNMFCTPSCSALAICHLSSHCPSYTDTPPLPHRRSRHRPTVPLLGSCRCERVLRRRDDGLQGRHHRPQLHRRSDQRSFRGRLFLPGHHNGGGTPSVARAPRGTRTVYDAQPLAAALVLVL